MMNQFESMMNESNDAQYIASMIISKINHITLNDAKIDAQNMMNQFNDASYIELMAEYIICAFKMANEKYHLDMMMHTIDIEYDAIERYIIEYITPLI